MRPIAGSYDWRLVGLSLLIAIATSRTALDLSERVRAARGWGHRLWLIGGSIVLGGGLWSMQAIGLWSRTLPIAGAYDLPRALLSLPIAVLVAALALHTAGRRALRPHTWLIGGVVGAGLAALSYMGMAGLMTSATTRYQPPIVLLSLAFAIAASFLLLWLPGHKRRPHTHETVRWLSGVVATGIALVGARYCALAAARLTTDPTTPIETGALHLSLLTSLALGAATLVVLGNTGLLASLERRRLEATERASVYAALLARERDTYVKALTRIEERDTVFEAMTDSVVVYDTGGNIERANAAFHRLMGSDAQTAYIERPGDERMAWVRIRDEEGHPLPYEHWPMTRLLRGERLTGVRNMDVTIDTLDGREVRLNASGAPLRDATGQITGAVAIYHDVTERHHLERRTAAALHAILEMVGVLVREMGPDTPQILRAPTETDAIAEQLVVLTRTVLGCERVSLTAVEATTNMSRPLVIVGVTPEEAEQWRTRQPGEGLRDSLSPDQLDRLFRDGTLVVRAAEVPGGVLPYGARSLLLALIRVGGETVGVLTLDYGMIDHLYTVDEIALAHGVTILTGLIIERERLLRDWAAAQASEMALREANERMDAFLGLVSHEMRTPLTGISGFIQLAERRLRPVRGGIDGAFAADVSMLLQRAQQSLNRIERLIDDLLDIARIQADRLPIHTQPGDLLAIVRDIVEEYRLTDPDRVITFIAPPLPDLTISIDGERIGQVVRNYITNALKYAPPQLPIAVGVECTADALVVWVRDAGQGIPLHAQEHLWDRFYRAQGVEEQSGSSVGLGLGLYISRTIIEQHGGAVGVKSIPGHGATFWFSLPYTAPE